jgi:hypothetical protein
MIVIRVYDAAGNVIEAHEHTGDFKEWSALFASGQHHDQAAFLPCCRRKSTLKTLDGDAGSHNLGGRHINRGC